MVTQRHECWTINQTKISRPAGVKVAVHPAGPLARMSLASANVFLLMCNSLDVCFTDHQTLDLQHDPSLPRRPIFQKIVISRTQKLNPQVPPVASNKPPLCFHQLGAAATWKGYMQPVTSSSFSILSLPWRYAGPN